MCVHLHLYILCLNGSGCVYSFGPHRGGFYHTYGFDRKKAKPHFSLASFLHSNLSRGLWAACEAPWREGRGSPWKTPQELRPGAWLPPQLSPACWTNGLAILDSPPRAAPLTLTLDEALNLSESQRPRLQNVGLSQHCEKRASPER